MILPHYSVRLNISRRKQNHYKTNVRTWKRDKGGTISGLLEYQRARAARPPLFQHFYRRHLTTRRPRYWTELIAHYSHRQDGEISHASLWLAYTTLRTVPTSFARPERSSRSRWTGWPSLSTQITLHRWPELEQVSVQWGNGSEDSKELSMASSTRLFLGSPKTTRSGYSPHQKKRRFTSWRTSPLWSHNY